MRPGDVVKITPKNSKEKLTVKVEDGSKSDIILAKVESVSGGIKGDSGMTYEIGRVYEFSRDDILQESL